MAQAAHKDPEYLRSAIAEGKTSRDIADQHRISYKLVEIYLADYGIPFVSQKPVQN